MKTKLLLLLLGLFFFISTARAEDDLSSQTSFGVVAGVNIYDTKITSQDKNVFKISFDLNNSGETQSGIKYGVVLSAEGTQIAWDEKVYPETITLNKDETQKKEITYEAPSFLTGEYLLTVVSKSENGSPFARGIGGIVKLNGAGRFIELDPGKCFLKIEGDLNNKSYDIRKGVGVDENESIVLSCSLEDVSFFGNKVNFKTRTYSRNLFGELIQEDGGVVSLENNQFSIIIPKAVKPQSYDVLITLQDEFGKNLSNNLNAHYTLKGSNVIIQNVLLDKDSYRRKESPKLTFFWKGNIDYSSDSNFDQNLNLIISTLGVGGEVKNIEKSLELSTRGKENEITLNPIKDEITKIRVVIADKQNNVLDEVTIPVKTTQESITKKKSINWMSIVIIVILLSLLVILARKISSKGIKILIFLYCFCVIGLGITNEARADWWWMSSEEAWADGTANLNKSVYSPGETIYWTFTVDSAHCEECYSSSNLATQYCIGCNSTIEEGLVMWTAVNLGDSSSTPEVIFSSPKNPVHYTQSGESTTLTFTAPDTPGIYKIQYTFIKFRNFVQVIFPHPTNIGSYYGRLKLCDNNYLTDPYCVVDSGFYRTSLISTPSYTVVGAAPIDGSCGIAQGSYSATDTSFRSPFCSAGTVSATPGFPAPGTTRTWTCLGIGGINVSCSATRAAAPVNGVCGTRSTIYSSATTTWPSGSTFCSSGTASPLNPIFPASGATTNWQCLGSGGGGNANCSASVTAAPVDGVCGARNTTYPSTTSDWPVGSTLCSGGTASPVSVAFPASGSTASWQCLGSAGGADISCLATHQAAAIPTPILNFTASPASVNVGGSSTLTWTTANVSSCWASGDWSGWKDASGGNEIQLNIDINKTYYMECWHSSGGTTGVIPAFVAVLSPINGACGTKAATYPSTITDWPGGLTLCSSGTALPVNPTFPAPGSNTVWSCSGTNGGLPADCTAASVSSAVNGVCGTRSTSYSNSITDWPAGSFCSTGTASPANPLFPNINASTPWQCLGSGGGSDANCLANRANMPASVEFEEVAP